MGMKSSSKHEVRVNLELTMNNASLTLIAILKFNYHPGHPGTYMEPPDPDEVTDIEVVSLAIDQGNTEVGMVCTPFLADWIAENVDMDFLSMTACEERAADREAAEEYRYEMMRELAEETRRK